MLTKFDNGRISLLLTEHIFATLLILLWLLLWLSVIIFDFLRRLNHLNCFVWLDFKILVSFLLELCLTTSWVLFMVTINEFSQGFVFIYGLHPLTWFSIIFREHTCLRVSFCVVSFHGVDGTGTGKEFYWECLARRFCWCFYGWITQLWSAWVMSFL